MESAELVARAWAPGTDFPDPIHVDGLYHVGLSIICILWTLALIIVSLRIWGRWGAKQLGVGKWSAAFLRYMSYPPRVLMYGLTRYGLQMMPLSWLLW